MNSFDLQHHPQITMNDNVVHIHTQTIQAWPPFVQPIAEHIKPGITMRDIRLAILAERKFAESYQANDRGSSVYIGQAQPLQPRTIADTVMASIRSYTRVRPQRPVRGRKCTICRQAGHDMVNCPKRFTKEPISGCPTCGGMHWRINCPLLSRLPMLPVPSVTDL